MSEPRWRQDLDEFLGEDYVRYRHLTAWFDYLFCRLPEEERKEVLAHFCAGKYPRDYIEGRTSRSENETVLHIIDYFKTPPTS